jgi:hypothetical protein
LQKLAGWLHLLANNQTFTPEEILGMYRRQWLAGNLRGLLLDHQLPMYDLFYATESEDTVFHCSRRLGKSTVALVLLLECCLSGPNRIARFATGTQKSVTEIIHPLMNALIQDAPKEIRPFYHSSGRYLFPSQPGSELVIAGLDLQPDRLRGSATHLAVIDEAGFVKDLDYIITSILKPQFLTTAGRLILSSSSPESPNHSFVSRMISAQEKGAYIKMTIHDDSRPEVLARIPEFAKEAGGVESTAWRREYLSEVVVETSLALVPEFKEEVSVRELPLPPHFQAFTVCDLGYVDNTGIICGYVDFINAKRVVLSCKRFNQANSQTIANEIRKLELETFGENVRCRRFVDAQPLTIADFNSIHGLDVTRVAEDTVEAKINNVRLDCQTGTLIIHPRCSALINELKYGIWDTDRKGYARSSTFGHHDLLSALTYFCRHTSLQENPYPESFGFSSDTFISPYSKPKIGDIDQLKEVWNFS